MKKIWLIRKESEAVSPVIATILMVAITVVLAAVLYVMVLGFGGTSTTTPAASYSKTTITYGQKITVISITKTDVPWDDVKIQLSDGTNIAEWSPAKANQLTVSSYNYSTKTLGSITVACMLTDVSGNGYVSGTDYFTLKYQGATAFLSSTTYTAVLLYKVTGEQCGQGVSFTG
jgi:flagellin-like protein